MGVSDGCAEDTLARASLDNFNVGCSRTNGFQNRVGSLKPDEGGAGGVAGKGIGRGRGDSRGRPEVKLKLHVGKRHFWRKSRKSTAGLPRDIVDTRTIELGRQEKGRREIGRA